MENTFHLRLRNFGIRDLPGVIFVSETARRDDVTNNGVTWAIPERCIGGDAPRRDRHNDTPFIYFTTYETTASTEYTV